MCNFPNLRLAAALRAAGWMEIVNGAWTALLTTRNQYAVQPGESARYLLRPRLGGGVISSKHHKHSSATPLTQMGWRPCSHRTDPRTKASDLSARVCGAELRDGGSEGVPSAALFDKQTSVTTTFGGRNWFFVWRKWFHRRETSRDWWKRAAGASWSGARGGGVPQSSGRF